MKEDLNQAIEIVRKGGVIIYPTDTACGIGGRVDNAETVARIFSIKGRDKGKATPVLFSSIAMIEVYVQEISSDVRKELMEKYWPGALTIVLNAKEEKIPSLVRGGRKTVGVRIPDYADITQLIAAIGIPLVGTSANFSGESSIYTTKDIPAELAAQVDFILPGECTIKKASTVIDCTQEPWKVIREGGVLVNR
jgi:L-threonylcarbamoyladenylate synthase